MDKNDDTKRQKAVERLMHSIDSAIEVSEDLQDQKMTDGLRQFKRECIERYGDIS